MNAAASFIIVAPILYLAYCSGAVAQTDGMEEIPKVLTPTRLKQSLFDVPASVTVITSETIRAFGIRSIPEALRFVPGFAVTQVSGNDYRINYHNGNILTPRRLNVLIDGVSVYRPAIARVSWSTLPVLMDDIERIEVTRSPDSASYGANSMTAIVNVITKNPKDVTGPHFGVGAGNAGQRETRLSYGDLITDNTHLRGSLEYLEDSGFNSNHDGLKLTRFNLRSLSETTDDTIDLETFGTVGVRQANYIDRNALTYPDVSLTEVYLSGRWQHQISDINSIQTSISLARQSYQQEWRSCVPSITLLPELYALWSVNPTYAQTLLSGRVPSGGTSNEDSLAAAALGTIQRLGLTAASRTCADSNQNYSEGRNDFEVQDTWRPTDKFSAVSGLGLREDIGNSQTYMAGRVTNNSWRVFTSIDIRATDRININAAGYYEKDQLTGGAFSPRLAANFHLTPNQTLRFVVSKGIRMPDLFEQKANWSYWSTNYSAAINGQTQGYYYAHSSAGGALRPERIFSREIGYFGSFQQLGVLVDAKLYSDQLKSLISEKLQVYDFQPTNNGTANETGAEIQVTTQPSSAGVLAFFTYAYARLKTDNIFERSQYARHSGSAGVAYSAGNGWQLSLAYTGSSGNDSGLLYFGREDFTASKTWKSGDRSMVLALSLQHLDNSESRFLSDVNKYRTMNRSSAVQVLLTAKFGF